MLMGLPFGLLAGPLELPPAIASLFAENCGQCHSEKIKTSGFSIISGVSIRQGGNKHGQAVVAGHPEQSALLKMLKGELAPQMPLILYGSKHFDRYEFLLALSDNLGGIGLEHHRSSENSGDPGYFTAWDDHGSERGLLPHEMTHSWNGKFRRPAGLWTPDYRTPMQDNLLWVYEGQTSYWDWILGARSGTHTAWNQSSILHFSMDE